MNLYVDYECEWRCRDNPVRIWAKLAKAARVKGLGVCELLMYC